MSKQQFACWLFVSLLLATPLLAQEEVDDSFLEQLIAFLHEPEPETWALAFEMIRTDLPGSENTAKFVAELPKLKPAAQAGLIRALADRGDVSAKASLLNLFSSEEAAVRVAAIRSIAKLGGDQDVPVLVERLSADQESQAAARTSLTQIQGKGITKTIAQQLGQGVSTTQVAIVQILAARRALDTIPDIVTASQGEDPAVRAAAMTALGEIAEPAQIPELVRSVLVAEKGKERANAERNLTRVCNRIAEIGARSSAVLAACDNLTEEEQKTMLNTLGRIGGSAALARIDAAIQNPNTHSAGIVALANWPNAEVADKLIDLAHHDPHLNHQLVALRALIRIAPIDDGRSFEERLGLLQKAMSFSVRYVDRNYALQRAGAIRIPETLRWVVSFLDDPNYTQQACQTIVELAHIRDLRDDNKAEFHAALDRVLELSKDATVLDRANRYKKGQTWVRPK